MKAGALSLCCAVALSGCVSINPVTMLRLATMNPLEADPGAIAARLTLPEGVGVTEGTAAMTLQTTFSDGSEVEERFELESLPEGVWRLPPENRDEFRALQERVIVAEEADPDATRGSFSVGFEPCQIGEGPEEDARFSIAVRLDAVGEFLPLVNQARVFDLYDEEDAEQLLPCDEGQG